MSRAWRTDSGLGRGGCGGACARGPSHPPDAVHASTRPGCRLRPAGRCRRRELHLRAAGLVGDEQSSLRHRVGPAAGPDSASLGRLFTSGDVGSRRRLGLRRRVPEHGGRANAEPRRTRELAVEAIDCQLSGDAPEITTVTARLRGFKDSAWRSFLLARIALVEAGSTTPSLLEDAWRRSVADGDRSWRRGSRDSLRGCPWPEIGVATP